MALWRDGLPLLGKDCLHALVVNAGAFQNVPHLHLKLWTSHDAHERRWAGNRTYQVLKAQSHHIDQLPDG